MRICGDHADRQRMGRRRVSPVRARLLALAANASTAYPGC